MQAGQWIGHVVALAVVTLLTQVSPAQTTSYVAQAGQTPVWPYDAWTNAASNIQDAIGAATVAGSTVWVSNGVYDTGGVLYPANIALTNRVAITSAITVRSVNGPEVTIIKGASDNGNDGPAAVRCVHMADGSALIGFTVTNGYTAEVGAHYRNGGGIYGAWSLDRNMVVSNCIITGCSACYDGVGYGGGAYRVTFYDCDIIGNRAAYSAGAYACTFHNCRLIDNTSRKSSGGVQEGTLYNCTIAGNRANGGAAGGAYSSTLHECVVSNNFAATSGGGLYNGVAYNCLIVGNYCNHYGGGACETCLYSCTIVGNKSGGTWGEDRGGGGVYNCVAYNSIVYSNLFQASDTTLYGNHRFSVFTNCCTFPEVADWAPGNITGNPRFDSWGNGYGTDHVAGDYHLRGSSPCINKGINQDDWMTNAVDLDGRTRIQYETVDMGAYEKVFIGTMISFR